MTENKKEFLVVDDYGTGGIWFVVRAPTESDITAALPSVTVFPAGSRPDWMTGAQYAKIASQRTYGLDGLPDSAWMRRLRGGQA
jgi:hypothetical protein